MTKGAFFLLIILGFCAMWQKAGAKIILGKPQLRGPSISSVGSIVEFFCKLDEVPTEETILYQLFKEGDLNKTISEYSSHSKEEATYLIYVSLAHDGRYICKASVQNNSEIIPNFSEWKDFQVLVPVKGAHIISSPSLEDLWEGDSLTLQCNITEGTHVLYDWLLNDKPLHNNSSNNQLTIPRLSSQDSGKYICTAKSFLNETYYYMNKSEGRDIHVKESLSEPEISFEVGKNADGTFTAYVKCQVTKGSLPINFTIFRNNEDVTVVSHKHLNASFPMSIVLDQDMGTVYCQANNGKTALQSTRLNYTVESVGGTVTMTMEKIVGQDFDVMGVWVHCHVEKGTFPQYYWFLNDRRMPPNGDFYRTYYQEDSVLAISLQHSASAGVYHCEAVNSFDNTTRVSSPKTLISHEALNKIPTEVAAVVFTCFSLLICSVLACCIYGVVLRKRQSRIYMFRLKDFTDRHSIVDDDDDDDDGDDGDDDDYKTEEIQEADEGIYEEMVPSDDLDTESYIEDMEVVHASIMEDPDESEEEEETDLQ